MFRLNNNPLVNPAYQEEFMGIQHSNTWEAFENSAYAKQVVASLKRQAEDKNPDPKSAPGSLEAGKWQSGNGDVPNEKGDIKFHNINEVKKDIENVAKKAPTGKVAEVLVKMVRIAEAWEAKNDAALAPHIAELDDIINQTIAEYSTPTITADMNKRIAALTGTKK